MPLSPPNLPLSVSMPARKLPGRVSLQGREHPVQLAHSFRYCMKFSAPFQSHANLAAHGLCHVSELHQLLWSLVMEPVTKVPTATPTYSTRLANRL